MDNRRPGLIRPGRIVNAYKTNMLRAAENPVTSTSTRIATLRRSRSFSDIYRPLSSVENTGSKNKTEIKPLITNNQPKLPTKRKLEPTSRYRPLATGSGQNVTSTSQKPPRILSRRSKSFSELRHLTTIPENRTQTRPVMAQPKLAIKRKIEPPSKEGINQKKIPSRAAITKNVQVSSSSTQKPAVKRPTPAPYDFKGRFQIIQEKHTILKEKYAEMKQNFERMQEEIEPLRIEHEELLDKREKVIELEKLKNLNQKMIIESNKLRIDNDKVKGELSKVTEELKTLKYINKDLERKKDALEVQVPRLLSQVMEADKQRRMMQNMIQDLKGNIRVFCRVRPPLRHEQDNHLIEFKYTDGCTIEVCNNSALARRMPKQEFAFTQVFNENSTQADVFAELGDLVHSVLDGYNVCVFAYGQTGSGKTYTMEGGLSQESRGMIPRTADLLFHFIEELKSIHWEYSVSASFIEIYNDKFYDLLSNEDLPHEIKMSDPKGTDVFVTNIQQVQISKSNELQHFLNDAQRNRAQAKTYMNERSSRSHAVTKIEISGVNNQTNQRFTATLNLVDLAGSEKARDSEVVRLTETKNINKSLSTLSNVILAIMQKREHIPYRDSKLTHLLMPSLGGNSKCLMFANISPLNDNYSETLNTLRFASNVISCKVGAAKRNF